MLQTLMSELEVFVVESPINYISEDVAIKKEYVGQRIFEAPIYAVASADDELFTELKTKVIGEHFRLPHEWNPSAKSVLSFFLPFRDEIVKSNKEVGDPSNLWLHGRVEGQEFVKSMAYYVMDYLEKKGYENIYPIDTEDFFAVREDPVLGYSSNWSERHVAFVAGLGTFGLSKGIITEKGMAGRLCSIVTSAEFSATTRYYTDIYENCSMCGACIPRCPGKAISLEEGKKHDLCHAFLKTIRIKYVPRHGCGKCQTYVPCTKQIPRKKK